MSNIHYHLSPLRNANPFTTYVLTTESKKSRDGIPVLAIIGRGSNREEFHAEQAIPLPEYSNAADLVAEWGNSVHCTETERAAANVFCAAWPSGPQINVDRSNS